MTADFALETFDFGAPFRNLRIDLVERTAAFVVQTVRAKLPKR